MSESKRRRKALQARAQKLICDPDDPHFYGQDQTVVELMVATFTVFAERFTPSDMSDQDGFDAILELWRKGLIRFAYDESMGQTSMIPTYPPQPPPTTNAAVLS